MSNYPNSIDDDSTLPAVNDNLTEIGGDAINALRDAVVQIETTLGVNIAGTQPNLAARLGVFINPDGTPNASVITSLGLVTLPIRNDQIAEAAGIPESKLRLDFRTQDLFNYVRDLSLDVNTAIGWIATEGIKLEPHLIGAIYRHTLDQIDVSNLTSQFLKNRLRVLRDNLQSYTLIDDMNDELLAHQWADGSPFGPNNTVVTNNGSLYSTYYAHVASGIFLNTSRFQTIPQINQNLQLFAEFIDTSSIFLLGTRIQNLYSAGISRVSRSSSLTADGYGQFIVPPTPAIAFLKNIGNSGSPFDNINSGDDIVQFIPSAANQSSNTFDAQFALVKPGDIIRVIYGDGYNIEVPYVIREKKYNPTTIGNKTYVVRIAGKNHFYSPNAVARIDRPLFNNNKYGELSISPVNNQFAGTPSLIINNPRGSQALGLGFDPDGFDERHYLLYLALYPTGHAADGYIFLPGIDVTGNQGKSPGAYTLESIVQATNNAFRAPGFNYRFTAFAFGGEFGICLADSYNNAAFSIVNGVVAPGGVFDAPQTTLNFPNNVVDLFPTVGTVAPDPLGFSSSGSGVASPPFMPVYGSSAASQYPTKLFVPLKRNNYYVNGSESEKLAIEDVNGQALDGYGDGYWVATVQNIATPGRVQVTYRVPLDLSASGLKAGKTVVIQSLGAGSLVDFGRFIIESVSFNCAPDVYTDITVYDAVHAKGFTPALTVQPFAKVKVYFCADSVSFNTESATDFFVVQPFKRHFEVYVNDAGFTYTQERGRINLSGGTLTVNDSVLRAYSQLNKLDIITISPKLRGFQFGSVNKITLNMTSFVSSTGVFTGYLASYDGITFTHKGPTTSGKMGEIIRFYDETNTDYIDIIFASGSPISDFSNQVIDFQLFPTLQLDDEIMLLGTCQVDDTTHAVSRIVDRRQFGNTSEKDLSSSVFNIMSAPEKYLHTNGIIRGFDIDQTFSGSSRAVINLTGGVILVNGKIIDVNNETIVIPIVKETFSSTIYPVNWAMCINDLGEYDLVPLLDFDSVLGTPSTIARTFTALDFISSTTYTIPAVTFPDLINRRPDLTILYIVSSVITGTPTAPIITITTKDARRFVYKKDWGERPTIATGTFNGEFRNLNSLTTWFNLNPIYNNSITIKGTFTDTDFPGGLLSFTNFAKFYGDGSTNFSVGTWSAANVELNDINITGSTVSFSAVFLNHSTLSFAAGGFSGNSVVKNSTITTTGSSTFQTFSNTKFNNVTFNFGGSSNTISFNDCILNNCTLNFSSTNSCAITAGGSVVCELNSCTVNFNSGSNVNFTVIGSIDDNIFRWASTSQGPITLNQNFHVTDNKFFITTGSALSSFLSVLDASNGTISNNHFFRSTSTLTNGYILAPAVYTSGTVSVVDNFFDSSTINGTDQNLVKNLPLQWPYKLNLNTPYTSNARRITTSGTYTVALEDQVIALNLTGAIIVTLPNILLSPPGRTVTIKDANGTFDINPVTIRAADPVNEAIENLYADYIYKNTYGSITLVAVIDPNGGANGSGLTPKYMWSIV